jgi:putative ABC transport system permease protein
VLGAEAAAGTALGVGDEIYLTHGRSEAGSHQHREYSYEVVGILEPTGSAHDRAVFTDLESSWIVHAHDRRKQELGTDIELTRAEDVVDADRKITGVYLRVAGRRGQGPSAALPQVFDRLRRNPTLTVVSPSDQIAELFKIVGNIDQILVGMAAVVMVSSGIGIMLALYNSMEQRRRQIAVMRVLGCSRGRVFGLVVTESAMLGLLGAALGVVVAFVGVEVVSSVLAARLGLVIEARIGLELMLIVVVSTVALSSVAGLVPAVMGYRTSVVRNLRPIG